MIRCLDCYRQSSMNITTTQKRIKTFTRLDHLLYIKPRTSVPLPQEITRGWKACDEHQAHEDRSVQAGLHRAQLPSRKALPVIRSERYSSTQGSIDQQ